MSHAAAAVALGCAISWAATCAAETLVFDPNELVAPSTAAPNSGAPCLEITDDGVAHVLWAMGMTGDEGVYLASSPPGGGYGPATRLDTALPASIDYGMFRGPTLRSVGSFLAAGWKNQMTDAPLPIWVARSTTMGASWEAAQRADPGPVGADEFRDFQAVALFPDGRVAQTWMLTDSVMGTTRFEWAAQDGTGTFGPPVTATGAAPGQPCECCYPDDLVLDDGMTVLVAYRGNDANQRTIRVARSTDAGASFPEDLPVDTSGWIINACPATGPSLAAEGATVLVTWMSGAGGNRAWLARSIDRGATWSPMVQVDDFGGTRSLNYPEVALRGDMAVVVWEGRRTDGGRGIFASVSIDAGVSWGPSVLVSDDMDGSSRMSPTVAIAPDYSVEVAWIDTRLGTARVFRARGQTTTSAAAPYVQREKMGGPLEGSLPVVAALLSDGVATYQPTFGAGLPFTDPEPVLLPSVNATLVFYAFDDPATPRIGVVKNLPMDSIDIVALP